MENKAGLTGQTVPGRRIPGHWPYLGPDELAETEPVFARTRDVFLSFTPPRARAGQARPAWPHLDYSMSRLRSAGSPARSCTEFNWLLLPCEQVARIGHFRDVASVK